MASIPKRIVLRLHTKYELQEAEIIQRFFSLYYPTLRDEGDYYSHLCAPNISTKTHIVLDLYCSTCPDIDLNTIEHQVLRVAKDKDELCVVCCSQIPLLTQISHFIQLDRQAGEEARGLSHLVRWGTDRRCPEGSLSRKN